MIECLIVDDEKELADTIKEYFAMFGVSADTAYDLPQAVEYPQSVGVILLDINLPSGSGYDVAKAIKERFPQTKILFLSARREDFDILQGYSVGGDDYIVKPCSLQVLLAKVKYALKLSERVAYKDYVVDTKSMVISKNGTALELTNMEYNLLSYLIKNRGIALDKTTIIQDVWGEGYYSDNTLNVHINRLRDKIGDADGCEIQTLWGVGYRFGV